MGNIQYYVLVNKDTIVDKKEINEIEPECSNTKLPFSEKLVNIYLISKDKHE